MRPMELFVLQNKTLFSGQSKFARVGLVKCTSLEKLL